MALMMTLLMVVGCDVSPNISSVIPKGCVNVSLNIEDGRTLNVSSTVPSEINYWQYSMTPLWNEGASIGNEEIYGVASYKELKDNNIGWVTPGLWKIEVFGLYVEPGYFGYLYYGESEIYINENNDQVFVYLKPYEFKNLGNLEISISQPELSSDENIDYYYCYSIKSIRGNAGSELSGLLGFDTETNTYSVNLEGLNSDYYNICISIYRNKSGLKDVLDVKNSGVLIGAETIGVFVQDMATVKVTGTVDPSDFVKGYINISLLSISGSISHNTSAINTDIVFTLKDSTYTESEKTEFEDKYNITYDWYVNGIMKASYSGIDNYQFTHKFSHYGPKEVSCVVTYQNKTLTERVYTATIKDTFTITP